MLLRGESGVGKDVLARAIHEASDRSSGPFVKVNCAALPSDLLESELFGYEKGAFTGAYRRKTGHFEHAAGGKIFREAILDQLARERGGGRARARVLHVECEFDIETLAF